MKTILIISTTGMGDTLWGTPAIRAIKKKFSQVSIDLLIRPQWIALFKEKQKYSQLDILSSKVVSSNTLITKPFKK